MTIVSSDPQTRDRDQRHQFSVMPRPDLPPITRRFSAGLITGLDLDGVDADTAVAVRQLGSLFLNAIAELENDQIIARGRPMPANGVGDLDG